MHPKWTALIAAIVTAVTAVLQKGGLDASPTAIAGAASGIILAAHTAAHPATRRKARKLIRRHSGKAGVGLWVWNATDAAGHVAKARAHGYGWLAVKVHDGTSPFNEDSMIHEYRRLCWKYGIKFGAWGYCHPGSGKFAADRAAALGAAFYIADVEVEFETAPRDASRHFIEAFRATKHHFTSLHLSSFGRVDLHPGIDWRTWSEAGWDFMPQAYSCESVELSPAACLRHAEDFWDRRRVQPTLGAYAGARGRLTADQLAGQCRGLGLTGVSVWEASTATPLDLDRIARVV